MNHTDRNKAWKLGTGWNHPSERPKTPIPDKLSNTTTFTSGPAAMLHSVAPGRGRRIHVGNASQRPQHDLIGGSPNLPAGQRVAELVKHHNQEEGQILQHIPSEGRVARVSAIDLKYRHHKPGPMQEHINSREAKQANGTLARGRHLQIYSTALSDNVGSISLGRYHLWNVKSAETDETALVNGGDRTRAGPRAFLYRRQARISIA